MSKRIVLDEDALNINIRRALTNASNYPDSLIHHVLGTNMQKIIDAVFLAVVDSEIEDH